jgi:uncharacterized protein YndB with AHSA1/START domain
MLGTDSSLVVRRSIFIEAEPPRIWEEFADFDHMNRWWGAMVGEPEAGTAKGMWLMKYEPLVGSTIEMEVMGESERLRFGGRITAFDPGRALEFENDWIPNQGWLAPTAITIRITPGSMGSVVEMLHHGFEKTGEQAADLHAGYEEGWGMTQLNALRAIVGRRPAST